ncbi:MAG: tRNA (guanosine(37)-N1)-methyltransferase TrmD [Kiritimatiellae bacterium]|nr:tRNA (guanosine(37)-N1)-methyltransferase TrmD [Kiritimatiellia bacterium]
MKIDIITIFPAMLNGFLQESMLKQAVKRGAVEFNVIELRSFTTDVHQRTDDRPYGGGPGMVMKPEPLCRAIESVVTPESRIIFMTPQGQTFEQSVAEKLVDEKHIIFICGHYEGVDERVCEMFSPYELSIGDYVLTNGVLPATVVVDAVVRLLPGVLGGEGAAEQESFSAGCLEHPQYTRPPEFRGLKVPEVLLSGNHEAIASWRTEQSELRTKQRRPDLL